MDKVDLNWIMCRIDEIKEKMEYRISYDVDTPLEDILAILARANSHWGEMVIALKDQIKELQ